jgi:biopolymer transport protein ExbD
MRLKLKTGINLAPIVDIVFLLLTFFLLNANLQKTHELTVDLPASESGQAKEKSPDEMAISLDAAGKIYFAGKEISRAALESKLLQLRNAGKINCKLAADQKTPYASVVDILGLLQKYKVQRIELIAKQK